MLHENLQHNTVNTPSSSFIESKSHPLLQNLKTLPHLQELNLTPKEMTNLISMTMAHQHILHCVQIEVMPKFKST